MVLEIWLRMRREEPEQFHSLVKMHLSFLLDLATDDCDCSFLTETSKKKSGLFSATPKRFRRGVMDGLPLTMEGVCQVYQLIRYLSGERRISTEGIFRKHGSLKKVQCLRERLNKGLPLDLDNEEFSVHEVAAVFKGFLSELPEPLLTDAYYTAHVQVTTLDDIDKKINSLQLLFLLIPEPNYRLLKDTLLFLHEITLREDSNKMSSNNLGTVFATHILCPRKLSAEALKSNHILLTKSVSFMIDKARELFECPEKLMTDIRAFWNHKKSGITSVKIPVPSGSPVVKTVFSFVDHRAVKEISEESSTDTALAALYAHVQAMPESAQKKKLIQKLNDANGCGTPGRVTPFVSNSKKAKCLRQGGGSAIKSLLTPRRTNNKEDVLGRIGSYSFSSSLKTPTTTSQLHSFKRQNSENDVPPTTCTNQKLLSPQSSPAIMVSPNTLEAAIVASPCLNSDYPKTIHTPTGLKVPIVDLTTPTTRRSAPPVPPRISSLPSENESGDPSPISSAASKMPSEMQDNLRTPRCRRPVMALINDNRDSPCQPLKYNEDEPDDPPIYDGNSSSSGCDESDRYLESLEDKDDYDSDISLKFEFKKYLQDKVALKEKSFDSVIAEEADELLNKELALSESMQRALDGEDPQHETSIEPSVLEPVDVDEECDCDLLVNSTPKLEKKRRSLTEQSPCNPLASSNSFSNPKSIYFETDL